MDTFAPPPPRLAALFARAGALRSYPSAAAARAVGRAAAALCPDAVAAGGGVVARGAGHAAVPSPTCRVGGGAPAAPHFAHGYARAVAARAPVAGAHATAAAVVAALITQAPREWSSQGAGERRWAGTVSGLALRWAAHRRRCLEPGERRLLAAALTALGGEWWAAAA